MPPIGYPDQRGGQAPAVGTRRPRGWYPEPRDRNTDRGRPPEPDNPSYTNRATVLRPVYPAPRLRVEFVEEFEEVFDRVDPQNVTVLGPAGSFTFTFSGIPDRIDIAGTQEFSLAFLDQNLIRMGGFAVIPANQVYSTEVMARAVAIQNLGAANGDFGVVAKWRRPLPIEARQADIGAPR